MAGEPCPPRQQIAPNALGPRDIHDAVPELADMSPIPAGVVIARAADQLSHTVQRVLSCWSPLLLQDLSLSNYPCTALRGIQIRFQHITKQIADVLHAWQSCTDPAGN